MCRLISYVGVKKSMIGRNRHIERKRQTDRQTERHRERDTERQR